MSPGNKILVSAAALFLCVAPARAQSSAEMDALRARVEQQSAELDALRAIVQRLDLAAVPAPATADAPAKGAAPAPAPVTAGTGTIKFNGLLQGWLAGGDAGFQDTFRIRRAELKFSGDLGKNVGWVVMIDPSKSLGTVTGGGATSVNQATRPLQDAFLTVGRPAQLALTAGQFKIPISREGLESSAVLDTVERALFISDRARGGAYGDIRDIGLSVKRSVANRYDVTFGIFNGTGESQNETDRNERKALSGRFSTRVPGIEGLQLGTSAAWGGGSGDARRDRATADLLFVRGALKLKSEVAAGRDGALDRFGFYVHGGYRIRPRVELVARFDQWDPDTGSEATPGAARERDYIAGANISITESLRLQANLVRKTFASDAAVDRNLFLINMQTSW
jgi:phosphate-selective porin